MHEYLHVYRQILTINLFKPVAKPTSSKILTFLYLFVSLDSKAYIAFHWLQQTEKQKTRYICYPCSNSECFKHNVLDMCSSCMHYSLTQFSGNLSASVSAMTQRRALSKPPPVFVMQLFSLTSWSSEMLRGRETSGQAAYSLEGSIYVPLLIQNIRPILSRNV